MQRPVLIFEAASIIQSVNKFSPNVNVVSMHVPSRIIGFTISAVTLTLSVGCSINPPMQEMSDARQSVEAAQTIGAEHHAPEAMTSAQTLLSQAESDMQTGDYEEAHKDAVAAREAARQALAITQAKHETVAKKIKPATEIIVEPVIAKEAPLPGAYTVEAKDSLWKIAAKPSVYNDAFLWPLLFKANADIIHNADLIQPGQSLKIERNPSPYDIDTAINHTRFGLR